MKKIEIKEIGIKSAFKSTLYITIVPLGIMAAIGLLMTFIGVAIGQGQLLILGIPYIFMSFVMMGLYGLFSMLTALVYNKFSTKFGGLELVIKEQNELNHDIGNENRINGQLHNYARE